MVGYVSFFLYAVNTSGFALCSSRNVASLGNALRTVSRVCTTSAMSSDSVPVPLPEYPVFDPNRAEEVNIKLEGVKNMRDLSTAREKLIKPGLVYRTGCVSKCSPSDVCQDSLLIFYFLIV